MIGIVVNPGAVVVNIYGRISLLRSLTIKPEYRKLKIGSSLIRELEKRVKNMGLNSIDLLTETARDILVLPCRNSDKLWVNC
jgi:N-acetylglutamate synthase-like GNAT family acetyltransferase